MIERTIIQNINQWLNSDQFIILKWARRVWKTTILKYIEKELKKDWKNTFFINCDDLDFSSKIQSSKDLIFYLEEFFWLKINEKNYIFLDEFQFIKNSWLLLKNIYDSYPKIKILAWGSSSLEITKNVEFLTGRSIEFFINWFSFEEFCNFKFKKNIKKIKINDLNWLKIFYKFYQNNLDRYLQIYLKWWWYPQILLENKIENKKILFKNYLEKYIEKDIISFLKIENISAFNKLIKLLSSQIWNLLNKNEISNTIWITNKTTEKYLDILQWTYLINLVKPFFKNIRSEISKSPKIYFYDLWLRNLVLWINENLNELNLWAEIENFVFNIFNEKLEKINFYRTISWSEIDFILDKNYKEKILIEVKYSWKIKTPIAFNNFEKKYPEINVKKIVITKNYLDFKDWIYFIPVSILSFVDFN